MIRCNVSDTRLNSYWRQTCVLAVLHRRRLSGWRPAASASVSVADMRFFTGRTSMGVRAHCAGPERHADLAGDPQACRGDVGRAVRLPGRGERPDHADHRQRPVDPLSGRGHPDRRIRSPGATVPVQASAERQPMPRRPCRAAPSRRSRTQGQEAAAAPLPHRECASPRSARWQEAV